MNLSGQVLVARKSRHVPGRTKLFVVRLFVLSLLITIHGVIGTRGADRLGEPKFLLTWGKRGDKPGEFYSPINIAISKRDEIFVGDLNNGRIQKFSTDGKYLGGFELLADKLPRKSCAIGGMALADDEQALGESGCLIYLAFMNQNRGLLPKS